MVAQNIKFSLKIGDFCSKICVHLCSISTGVRKKVREGYVTAKNKRKKKRVEKGRAVCRQLKD
jgi:hypothetical protein